jgi:hypothetical protein
MTEQALIVHEEQTAISLLEGDSPATRVQFAMATAQALAPVIDNHKLYAMIPGRQGPRKHVLFEGWQVLGQMLGVFPVTVWTKPLANGYEARVEARTLNGALVGAAEAQCTKDEENWLERDDYALRSMAQTRAGSKALASCLRFIVTLAGYEGTPAEEMTGVKKPQAPAPDVKQVANCAHGPRVWKAGANKQGKPYRGWFCGKNVDGCKPIWVAEKQEAPDEEDAPYTDEDIPFD